jgi:hypothetical protein
MNDEPATPLGETITAVLQAEMRKNLRSLESGGESSDPTRQKLAASFRPSRGEAEDRFRPHG